MKALVFTAASQVELRDVDEPTPLEGDVVVDVVATGICGSDLHGVVHPGFRKPPLILGHEFAGTLDGQPVAVNPIIVCGECDVCRAGLTSLCRNRKILGIQRPGALAERIAVPATSVHQLPDGLGWDRAGMIEPLANAIHAWALAGDVQGARVAVLGAGAVGLVTVQVAQALGVASVTVSDPVESRAQVAADLGAEIAVGGELTGEFDVIVDAAGFGPTRAASISRLRPGGTAVWVGLAETDAGFDATDLIRTGKRVFGSFAYTDSEFVEAIDMVSKIDVSWVTQFPLSSAAGIFLDLMNHKSSIVKAIFTTDEV